MLAVAQQLYLQTLINLYWYAYNNECDGTKPRASIKFQCQTFRRFTYAIHMRTVVQRLLIYLSGHRIPILSRVYPAWVSSCWLVSRVFPSTDDPAQRSRLSGSQHSIYVKDCPWTESQIPWLTTERHAKKWKKNREKKGKTLAIVISLGRNDVSTGRQQSDKICPIYLVKGRGQNSTWVRPSGGQVAELLSWQKFTLICWQHATELQSPIQPTIH